MMGGEVPEEYPLSEVRPGQEGIWRTVVKGTEIQEFRLRILGVVDNFSGPGQPVVIAEALDPENILSGPVAGMSGSPVYIDGRLLGAYAYGFLWPKEQAIIGITPISKMLEILEFPEEAPSPVDRIPGFTIRPPDPGNQLPAAYSSGPSKQLDSLAGTLKRLPTPLSISGVSESTLSVFRDEIQDLGFEMTASPNGAGEAIQLDVRPGAAVAGVLMHGDFGAAATGTITWTDGERLLAFGHPFLQSGTVAIPLAGAEILAVVRSARSSFKMSNVGRPEGRIFQDRLTGIAGMVGKVPPMADLNISVSMEGDGARSYSAEVWPHPQMLSLMTAVATLESLSNVMIGEERETVTLSGTIRLVGGEELPLFDRSTGPSSNISVALSLYSELGGLLGNPYTPVSVESIDIDLDLKPGWVATSLRELRLGDGRPRAGKHLPLIVGLQDYWGHRQTMELSVPIPASARRGDQFEIVVVNNSSADAIANPSGGSANDLSDLLRKWRSQRRGDAAYVFLLSEGRAAEIDGHAMPDLPPSIRATLSSENTRFVAASGGRSVVWETSIPMEGVFYGEGRVEITLE